jgi:hypothetical protein
MKSKYSILHNPLDLKIRSASSPKYYFWHFPYLKPPKVFGVPSPATLCPSVVVPLGSPCRLISQNFHNLQYLTLSVKSVKTLPAIITRHTERTDQDGPQVEERVFIPYPGMPTSCSTPLNIIFPIPCSLFLLVCLHFLSCMWDVNIIYPVF